MFSSYGPLYRRVGLLGCAAALSLATLLTACAGDQHRRAGKTFLAQGDYDRAVEAAREALAKDPDNPRHLDLLSDAQTAAAEAHFDGARRLMDAHRPAEALPELDTALQHMPAHPGANTLRAAAEKALQQNRTLVNQAREAAAREDWGQAVLLAQQACSIDQGDVTARELLDLAQSKHAPPETVASLHTPEREQASPVAAVVATPQAAKRDSAVAVAQASPPSPVTETNGRPDQRLIEIQPLSAVRSRSATMKPAKELHHPEHLITSEASRTTATQPAGSGVSGMTFWTTPAAGREARGRTLRSEGVASNPPADRSGERSSPLAGRIRPPADSASRVASVQPSHVFRGAISRDDRRYKKRIALLDGISIKLEDTDKKPLDADFEIIAGRSKLKPDDVPVGGKVEMRGVSGRKYVMTVIWIDHDQDTVHFSLDRMD